MYEYLDKRYALALYEIALEKNKVEEFLEELRQIVELTKTNEELKIIISHPQITTIRKKEIFKNIFKGRIQNELLAYLLLLIDHRRIVYLEEKVLEMEKIHLERSNKLIAEVTTAIPLIDNEREELINQLNKKYGKTIILKETVDESIIGGVLLSISNKLIDGTIKSKLEEIKKILLKKELR